MKALNTYINEKLVLSKDTFKGPEYNPDSLSDEYIILYSTEDDENDDEEGYDYFDDFIDQIVEADKNYDGYVVFNSSLSDIKNKYEKNNIQDIKDNDIVNRYVYLEQAIKKYVNGNDLGNEVRLAYGHIEIDCINSGSRATYYIYAISPDISSDVEEWFEGSEEINLYNILYTEGNIEKIEIR